MGEDYRKKYKKHFNIEFGKEYAIHHIDFDRKNNNINNLLLLPRGLHNKYHACLSSCEGRDHKISGYIGDLKKGQLTALGNLANALKEIEKWVKWKQYNYDEYLKQAIFDGTEEYKEE